MLMKLILCSHDFEKSLKRRRLVALALLCVGLVGLVCYFFLVPESTLPDFAQGFYLGAASGICLGSVVLLVRSQYLLTHPEAQRRARIQETDERELSILHTSFQAAGVVTFFATAGALFVVLPFSRAAFYALLGGMILYALVFFAACKILEKRV